MTCSFDYRLFSVVGLVEPWLGHFAAVNPLNALKECTGLLVTKGKEMEGGKAK